MNFKSHCRNIFFAAPFFVAVASVIASLIFAYQNRIVAMDICFVLAFVIGGFATLVWHIDEEKEVESK